ncbi:hypothetical protein GRF29_1g3233854 [Pseudopithomyces chartarum]|uniref:Uncharacterized protein n=1 Tax=Pseudopithomyces chartarum TaxID=1892770 RepID=A0AAN6M9V6_9PLEO|nr:hypothetical protein GRF29_1g3233854 [Pseudopithomyces chartarum]
MGSDNSNDSAFKRPVKPNPSYGTTQKVTSPKPTSHTTITVKEVIRGPPRQPTPIPPREPSPDPRFPARKRDSIVTLADDDVINDWILYSQLLPRDQRCTLPPTFKPSPSSPSSSTSSSSTARAPPSTPRPSSPSSSSNPSFYLPLTPSNPPGTPKTHVHAPHPPHASPNVSQGKQPEVAYRQEEGGKTSLPAETGSTSLFLTPLQRRQMRVAEQKEERGEN